MTEHRMFQEIVKPYFEAKGRFVWEVDHARMPDVYTAYNVEVDHWKEDSLAIVHWYELKVVSSSSDMIRPDWRPGQLSWIYEQVRKGIRNVSLILFYEPDNECRLYRDCKKEYGNLEFHEIIRRP